MSSGKHVRSVRDFWGNDRIGEIPFDGVGWQPADTARSDKIRILALRSTLHRIGAATLQEGKSPENVYREIRALVARELLTIEQW